MRCDLLTRSYVNTKESCEALRRMLSTLDDPYSRFIESQEVMEMQGDAKDWSGVGIQLSLNKDIKELVVISPIESSPAGGAWGLVLAASGPLAGGLVLGGIALARGGPVAGDPGKPSPVGSWNQRSCLR